MGSMTDFKSELIYWARKFDGTVLVSNYSSSNPDLQLALTILDRTLPNAARFRFDPNDWLLPRGTKLLLFVGVVPTPEMMECAKNKKTVGVIYAENHPLPVHIRQKHVTRGPSYCAAVASYLDQNMPYWRQGQDLSYQWYLQASINNYEGLSEEEKQDAQETVLGMMTMSWTMESWNAELKANLRTRGSGSPGKRIQLQLANDLAAARPARICGEPCLLLRKNFGFPGLMARELANLFYSGELGNAVLVIVEEVDQHLSDDDSSKRICPSRNVTVFGKNRLLNQLPWYVSGLEDMAHLNVPSEAELLEILDLNPDAH